MIFEFKYVSRLIFSRRRGLATFTSIAAIAGLIVGVSGLVIALALTRGFQVEMREKLLASTPHISIFRCDGADIDDWDGFSRRLLAIENVRNITGAAAASVFLVSPTLSNQAVLHTFDMPEGDERPLVSIGSELADRSGVVTGSEVEIIVLEDGSETRRSSVIVSSVFKTGLLDYDSTTIRISAKGFAFLHGQQEFRASSLNVTLNELDRSSDTALLIKNRVGGDFRVVDWQEANRPLFAALELEKKVAISIIGLIVILAILNITTTLALLVNERRCDIGVLRTCGARTKSIVMMFVIEGILLGFPGILGGLLAGVGVCWLSNVYRIVSLPSEVYSIAYVPLLPTLNDALGVIFICITLCLLATFYPAFMAARIKPMENFRIR